MVWSIRAAGGPTFEDAMGWESQESLFYGMPQTFVRRSKHTFPALGLTGLENAKLLPNQLEHFLKAAKILRKKLDDILDSNTCSSILLIAGCGSST